MRMRLEGKTAIVTGGASNLGAQTARLFAAEGGHVVIADLLTDAATELAEQIEQSGGSACAVATDVTSPASWANLVERVCEAFGGIDVLVNCAGIHGGVAPDLSDVTAWDLIMAVNIKGQFLGCDAVAEQMRTRGGGSIVNFSSVGGIRARGIVHPAYPASKSAVLGLTRNFARRYGPDGIRVNAIVPGLLPVMRTAGELPPGALEEAVASIPLKRPGTADEIARATLFLASGDSSYITGTYLIVDGGMSCI
jgi:NAD(P)-dependent dehydrogenase (short-subunit alcohol dehydrogenase family)